MRRKQVTVIGAGVVGLTTAVALENAGHGVRVIAREPGVESSSGAAGAVWYPYHSSSGDSVNRWAGVSYEWLSELHRTRPEAGVVGVPRSFVVADGTPAHDRDLPEWAGALPADQQPEFVPAAELPAFLKRLGGSRAERNLVGAWRFRAPVVEPRPHLEWLTRQLEHPVEIRTIERDELDRLPGDVIVNCTGHRARALFDDPRLTPFMGQTVIVPVDGLPGDALADDRRREDLFYFIPRSDAIVLGGYDVDESESGQSADHARPEIRPNVTETILARCREAGIVPGRIVETRAGWRPVRDAVRLEREGNVIHNYGHGGAGYTLAWGCALEVAGLLDD